MSEFVQRLLAASQANRSLLCVGLDPDPSLMAIEDVAGFNRAIPGNSLLTPILRYTAIHE